MLAADPWRLKTDYLKIGATFGAQSDGSKQRGIAYEQQVIKKLAPWLREHWPEWKLLIGPWYQNQTTKRWRQPDAVMLHEELRLAIVLEVKLNWKDGLDEKLVDTYLPIVKRAHELDCVWPLLVTRCTRGYPHPVLLQFEHLDRCQSWRPGDPTPMMLVI